MFVSLLETDSHFGKPFLPDLGSDVLHDEVLTPRVRTVGIRVPLTCTVETPSISLEIRSCLRSACMQPKHHR